MKKFLNIIIVILFTQISFAQIYNCAECDTKSYEFQDISHLSLLELKILRNEIFARHQYVFKDEKLSEYFIEKYVWYKPNYNTKNDIKLNPIEIQNISLFSKYETKKEALKTTIIKELKEIKRAFINNDTTAMKSLLKKELKANGEEFLIEIKNKFNQILAKIDMDNINWYNENGLYKVTTDNGLFVNEVSITIQSDTIILKHGNTGASEQFSDKTEFSYGSDYYIGNEFYSENEYLSWYIFKIRDNKLVFIEHQGAG